MNIRQAILSAADSIEQNPTMFSWTSINLPNLDCGTPGCALGWIAFYRGKEVQCKTTWISDVPVGVNDGEFYACMNRLTDYKWKYSAFECAKALRQYADIHHPEKDHIPASIRAIFDVPEQVSAII